MGPETWIDLVRRACAARPDETLYTFLDDGTTESARLSYGELDRRARLVARRLRDVQPFGAHVVILCPPGLDSIVGFFGCLYAGMVAVTAPDMASARARARVDAILHDAGASAIVMPAAAAFETALPRIATDDDGADPAWSSPPITEHSLALLQYTSGSTAAPRGVMLTHQNMLCNAEVQRRAWRLSRDSIGVSWLPLYHDLGVITCLLQPVYVGFPTVMMPPSAFLQRPARWLEAIARHRATFAGGPCFAFDLCVRKTTPAERARLDLTHWTTAFNGAEPVHAEVLARFSEAFASSGFRGDAHYPCYGLAEANFVTGPAAPRAPLVRGFDAAALEHGQARQAREGGGRLLVGCGTIGEGHALRIVDPERGVALPDGVIGEIWVAGPSVARGYHGRDDDTRETFCARITGDGPFLRTGDLGFVQRGELFVTGRRKDLIIVRGLNHYPQDLELTVEGCDPRLRRGCGVAFAVEAGAG
ncbi:MAG TPA: fatty acyl-AMP ligase, partial [Kofleriaceae bacterium]|nr:fatty acyl-AMP ligase [Kofleriaceae bacterium]